jgi:hypothetical protein
MSSDLGEEYGQRAERLKAIEIEIQQLRDENKILRESRNSELQELKARAQRAEKNNELLTRIIDRMSQGNN